MSGQVITGTAHFVSLKYALRYYHPYITGPGRGTALVAYVATKLANQEIFIGRPDLKPGETLSVRVDEGRYLITSAA